VFLAAPATQVLDVSGPFAVFARAADIVLWLGRAAERPYQLHLVSTTGARRVHTNSGMVLEADVTLRRVPRVIDTLLVVGGSGVEEASHDVALQRWLTTRAPVVRRLGSICTGAYVLAATGLLRGRRVATHWKWSDDLAKQYPDMTVDPEAVYVRDGHLYTTAGVTAGMDLALALVEEDWGAEIALQVARELVLPFRRREGAPQVSAALALQASDRRQLEEVRAWAIDHLRDDLRVERLAARATMSVRHFARTFRQDVGTTPARYIEQLRVEAAQRRLEESSDALGKIAHDCGLGSLQSMRRVFLRVLGVSPLTYRQQRTRRATL
jgi:transcriptional regulator GlxA family with amidase domain